MALFSLGLSVVEGLWALFWLLAIRRTIWLHRLFFCHSHSPREKIPLVKVTAQFEHLSSLFTTSPSTIRRHSPSSLQLDWERESVETVQTSIKCSQHMIVLMNCWTNICDVHLITRSAKEKLFVHRNEHKKVMGRTESNVNYKSGLNEE